MFLEISTDDKVVENQKAAANGALICDIQWNQNELYERLASRVSQ